MLSLYPHVIYSDILTVYYVYHYECQIMNALFLIPATTNSLKLRLFLNPCITLIFFSFFKEFFFMIDVLAMGKKLINLGT